MKRLACGLSVFFLTVAAAQAQSPSPIGHVQQLRGKAVILRGADTAPVAVGTALYRGDVIRTGKPGALGLVLADDTTISLGSNSEIALRDYDFDPEKGVFALVARMVRGSFVYVSGQLGKLAPSAVKLSIPDATIAVRGTKLLIEVQD